MGGILSTRWNTHRRHLNVDEARVLTAKAMATTAQLPQSEGAWDLQFSSTVRWGRVHDRVTLEATQQPFGGVRWHLRCTGCSRKRRALYVPPGAVILRCRVCAKLTYRSQRLSPFDRLTWRAQSLVHQLGTSDLSEVFWSGTPPHRPKRMHERPYLRRADKLSEVLCARDELFIAKSVLLLNRISPRWRQGGT
jgi:hypothetical protein